MFKGIWVTGFGGFMNERGTTPFGGPEFYDFGLSFARGGRSRIPSEAVAGAFPVVEIPSAALMVIEYGELFTAL